MFKPIKIGDKDVFDDYLSKFPQRVSELTFTNLFCWRKTKNYEYDIIDNHLVIRSGDKYFQPIGPDPLKMMKKLGGTFVRVDNELYIMGEEDRDHFDYVYLIEDLKKMEGRKFAPKRNFINRIAKLNPEVLVNCCIDECLDLQERWCNMRVCSADNSLQAEDYAVREALNNHEKLGISLVVVRINGKVEGFAIGEKLNEDTFVEHFEKGNPDFPGVYQFAMNELVKIIPSQFKFLNREQDLGNEGLRKAKQSYNPVMMIEKKTVQV